MGRGLCACLQIPVTHSGSREGRGESDSGPGRSEQAQHRAQAREASASGVRRGLSGGPGGLWVRGEHTRQGQGTEDPDCQQPPTPTPTQDPLSLLLDVGLGRCFSAVFLGVGDR